MKAFLPRQIAHYAACITFGLALPCACLASGDYPSAKVAYLARFPHFNPNTTDAAPGDIDTRLEAALSSKGQFSLVQREFELYAWQLLIAVSSPPDLTSIAVSIPKIARWESWPTTDDLSNPRQGDKSSLCSAQARLGKEGNVSQPSHIRELRATSTLSPDDALASETARSQFNIPLIDQNGNYVFYESILDPNQADYICKTGLLTRERREALARSHVGISFPVGTEGSNWSGSFSLKLAWKILDPTHGDVFSRFYTVNARVLDLSSTGRPVWRKVQVGLVGMHLVHKSQSAPERIWATFEQVDNLDTDVVDRPDSHASFFNPLCPLCTVDQPSEPGVNRRPTQVIRVIPISLETENLNREAQEALKSEHSVLQYYKLVGVQWPGIAGDPSSATPAYLANTVMETFLQPKPGHPTTIDGTGNRTESRLIGASCISCHAHAPSASNVSSEVPASNDRADGDFSWFLSQKLP